MPVESDVIVGTSTPEVAASAAETEDADHGGAVTVEAQTSTATGRSPKRVGVWKRVLAYGVLPGLALILAMGAGYLKWQGDSIRESQAAATETVTAATNSTIALLSYTPDTIDKDLTAAQERLTGSFRDSYTQLVHDVVIPGAKQKQISAVATVPAAASVTASPTHAAVVVFVDQTITIGKDAPTSTASSIRVTLDKISNRWLISQFEPI